LFAATSEVASMGFESGSEWLFPQFVDGGGYTTQFILLGSGDQVSHGELRFFTQSGQPMTIDFR
jgi:hypothetical protein